MTEETLAALDEANTKLAELRLMERGWAYGNLTWDAAKAREHALARGRLAADVAHWEGRVAGLLQKIREAARDDARA